MITDEEAGRTGEAHTAHVGQAFYDEQTTAAILAGAPYADHTGHRTTNDEDSLFAKTGTTAMATLTARDPQDPAAGWDSTFTCIIDPTATPPPAPMF